MNAPLHIPRRRNGQELDFTLADFDMPVLQCRLAKRIKDACSGEVQLFDAVIDGHDGDFAVLNVLSVVNCLDETKSHVTLWSTGDGRPDLVGKYRMVLNLHVDPAKTGGRDLLRVSGWELPLIVSERVRPLLSDASGAVFDFVS